MRVVVVIPPQPVVKVQQAVEHLGLQDMPGHEARLERLIAAATAHIDGPNGWLGRSLGRQTLEARFDLFDCDSLRLPYPPAIGVESFSLVGRQGATVVSPSDYIVDDDFIVPASGTWPTLPANWGRPRIRIRYQAGYEEVPEPIRQAILLMVGDMDMFTESVSDQSGKPTAIPMSTTVDALLSPYRVYF